MPDGTRAPPKPSALQDPEPRGTAQDLEKSEAFLGAVLETSLDGFWVVDPTGRLLSVNAAYCAMSGYSREELLGMRISDLEATETPEEIAANIGRILAAGGGRFERSQRRKDGSLFHVSVSVTFVGGPTGVMVCFLRDITERRAMEEALRASEIWHRQAIDAIPALVWTARPDGQVDYANASWTQYSGRTFDELTGDGWMKALHPDDLQATLDAFAAASASGGDYQVEQRLRRRDGNYRWFLARGRLLRDAAGNPVRWYGINVDIHDKKAIEQGLRESEAKLAVASRLAAMGTVVSGIAHEINNPLAAVLSGQVIALEDVHGLRETLRGKAPLDRMATEELLRTTTEALEDGLAGARRVSSIVKDMTSLGRPDGPRSRLRLGDIVKNALAWMPVSATLGASVEFVDLGSPEVLASAGLIEQLVVNLVTNAAKALPKDRAGRIVISCGPGPEGMARLAVMDDGVGMSPETLQRAFDPFFTTRPAGEGRGTGLGLAICQAIATAHGGTLTGMSEVGRGSTFRLEIPVAPPSGQEPAVS